MTRVVETLFCFLLAATAVQAQITTSHIDVRITGKPCELQNAYLVINEDDLQDRWVKLNPKEACTWEIDLGDGISTSVAKFSLRTDSTRTDCQKAFPNEDETRAKLEFVCCAFEGPLHNVSVTTKPAMPITYVRAVKPYARDRIPGVPCREFATFAQGQGAISQAQFSGEDVYLHLGPFNRKHQPPGLLINRIVDDGRPRDLTRDDVAYRMTVQRAQGKAGSAPTLSSNAIALEIKRLTDLKLERTRIEVIK